MADEGYVSAFILPPSSLSFPPDLAQQLVPPRILFIVLRRRETAFRLPFFEADLSERASIFQLFQNFLRLRTEKKIRQQERCVGMGRLGNYGHAAGVGGRNFH